MKAVQILVLSLAALFFVVSATPVHAQNEFVGAYFANSTSYTATSAILGYSYTGTNPSSIPSGSWLGGGENIVGTTGGGGLGYCPCFYQAGTATDNSGNVAYVIQFWGINGLIQGFQVNNVGTTSSPEFFTEIRANTVGSTTYIQAQGFAYNTNTQVQNNAPNIYTSSNVYTGDSQFYYGAKTACGTTIEQYQAGIESPNIGSGTWNINEFSGEVYANSYWAYGPGASTEGNVDYYLCNNGSLYVIGGAAMTGVNINNALSGTDDDDWIYTGTTIGNGVSLWSTSGSFTPFPCTGGYC